MEASESLNARVAGEIRAELARRQLTQADFAIRCGLSASQFSRRMTGEIPWSTNEIDIIAAELGIATERLLWPAAAS